MLPYIHWLKYTKASLFKQPVLTSSGPDLKIQVFAQNKVILIDKINLPPKICTQDKDQPEQKSKN